MSNKDKKRKDKKRKHRAAKKGVLPSSVQALLGYLGGGGPGPATQGDTRVKERAGVDAYDTLHSIIKSQQMMSANYMANLERMAFKTDITNELKKQGSENAEALKQTKQSVGQALEQTKKSVGQAVKVAVEKVGRTNTKKTPEEKLDALRRQMKFAARTPQEQRGDDWHVRNQEFQRKASVYQAEINIDRTYSLALHTDAPAQSLLPVAQHQSPARSLSVPKGGGQTVANRVSVESAPIVPISNVKLPSVDPMQGHFPTKGAVTRSPVVLTKGQDIARALSGYGHHADSVSSLLPSSKAIAGQEASIQEALSVLSSRPSRVIKQPQRLGGE
jgi:hypothetical protein